MTLLTAGTLKKPAGSSSGGGANIVLGANPATPAAGSGEYLKLLTDGAGNLQDIQGGVA